MHRMMILQQLHDDKIREGLRSFGIDRDDLDGTTAVGLTAILRSIHDREHQESINSKASGHSASRPHSAKSSLRPASARPQFTSSFPVTPNSLATAGHPTRPRSALAATRLSQSASVLLLDSRVHAPPNHSHLSPEASQDSPLVSIGTHTSHSNSSRSHQHIVHRHSSLHANSAILDVVPGSVSVTFTAKGANIAVCDANFEQGVMHEPSIPGATVALADNTQLSASQSTQTACAHVSSDRNNFGNEVVPPLVHDAFLMEQLLPGLAEGGTRLSDEAPQISLNPNLMNSYTAPGAISNGCIQEESCQQDPSFTEPAAFLASSLNSEPINDRQDTISDLYLTSRADNDPHSPFSKAVEEKNPKPQPRAQPVLAWQGHHQELHQSDLQTMFGLDDISAVGLRSILQSKPSLSKSSSQLRKKSSREQ
jgi:hypothetical protein